MAEIRENKETAQRAELYRKIWSIADDVRGAVDGWDFKQYILGILFYRFISENITEFFNNAEHEAGYPDFDYAQISDCLLYTSLKAAFRLKEENILEPIVLGKRSEVEGAAKAIGKDLANINFIDPAEAKDIDEMAQTFFERRKGKITLEDAKALLLSLIHI